MKPFVMIAAMLFASLCSFAEAQYYYSRSNCSNGYCAPTYSYSAPSYSSVSYPYYSAWEWKQWPTDPTYWIRVRYQHVSYSDKISENDGWLYYRGDVGDWVKHCLISQYAAKPVIYPVGRTEVGYYEPTYRLVQQAPYLAKPGVLIAKQPPAPIDPRDFLVPYQDDGVARTESAFKTQISATELALQVVKSEQEKEKMQLLTRAQLSRDTLAAQNDERFLSEIKELFALRQRSATIQSGGDAGGVVAIDNEKVAALVSSKCFKCHGAGGKVEKGIDFRTKLSAEQWKMCFRECATGEMPREGQPLSSEELDLIQDEWLAVVKRGS